MPAKSKAQQRLAQAALHGADFPKAKRMRASMDRSDLKHFAASVEHEAHTYDWRTRNNLKRGRG